MSSRLKTSTKNDSERSLIILPAILGLISLFIFWEILQSPLIQILKSLVGGLLLVYFSWEIIYFDSLMPGIQPASPLSPSNIKSVSGHTLHLNYALALINGAFFALFINWWM
ncbi:ADP-ribosylation factor-like protein 6-interacting protein 6 [Argiope bruennichi]|uniref:ADP-ribosylation factor-like protein like n=1 Tax=Argiope bruennichi TaxID=94029 RepID=A0A8T0EEV8_ARGBR|nr:ADP-ribosylation factor-like protein 6-interacting protein 6 [Argiope bruennichi]KAF8771431.1 ADP-ribosylation factor-like protein like [Argiope bruennichi]